MSTNTKLLESCDEYMTIKTLEQIINRVHRTVLRAIEDDKLVAYKASNIYYFKKSDVIKYITNPKKVKGGFRKVKAMNLDDFLLEKKDLFVPGLTKTNFHKLFRKIVVENFGYLQTKYVILKQTLITSTIFDKHLDEIKIYDKDEMFQLFSVDDIAKILCKCYYECYASGKPVCLKDNEERLFYKRKLRAD